MKRIMLALVLCGLTTLAHAGEKKGFLQDLGRSLLNQVTEDVRNQVIQEGIEGGTGVKDFPTSPSEAVNRTMTGKAQPNVFMDQAKSYWIQDMRHIMERSVALDWEGLGVDYDTDDELFDLTQDGYVHLRHGVGVRSEYNWAGQAGPVNCDFVYVFYNTLPNSGLSEDLTEECMYVERSIVANLFKQLKQSLGALGQVPVAGDGKRANRMVSIGRTMHTQGSGVHPTLELYANDRLDRNEQTERSMLYSLYGPMVRERSQQMDGRKFFVSVTPKTMHYDRNTQTLKVLMDIPTHIMGMTKRHQDLGSVINVTGPDFGKDPKAYDRDLHSTLNNKIVLRIPMSEAEYHNTQRLTIYYGPRVELYFTVLKATQEEDRYGAGIVNTLHIDIDKAVFHRVLTEPTDKGRSPYEARTIVM